jgi:hypothetical protein
MDVSGAASRTMRLWVREGGVGRRDEDGHKEFMIQET